MTLNNDYIQQTIEAQFGQAVSFETSFDLLSITVEAAQGLKLLQFLHDNETLGFRFLTDLTGIHYPENKDAELGVIYHLHNLVANVRLRVKLFVPIAKPDVFTATKLFPGANWMERETYDFYGINFIGHPDLRRILNADEMDYFPMRKEYSLEDPQRTDKDDEMFGR